MSGAIPDTMQLLESRELRRSSSVSDHLRDNQDQTEMSDCESDTSEVLSVGSESTPAGLSLEVDVDVDVRIGNGGVDSCTRFDGVASALPESELREDTSNTRTSTTSSPPRSPAASPASSSCTDHTSHQNYYNSLQRSGTSRIPSPGYSSHPPSSPAASVRSPASSSITASSPGRPEMPEAVSSTRYGVGSAASSHSHQILGASRYSRDSSEALQEFPARIAASCHPALQGHDVIYPGVERALHRTPITVPLVTRLSLSPPSVGRPSLGVAAAAAVVAGLQSSSPVLHPGMILPQQQQLLHQNHVPPHTPVGPPHPHLPIQQQQQQQIASIGASTLHHHLNNQAQHRLPVSKLLQGSSPPPRESSPLSPRDTTDNTTTTTSSGIRTPAVPVATNNRSNNNNNINNNNNNNNNNNLQHQGNLKFSIDNILKADFGRRITDPISLKKSRPKKVVQRPIDLTKDFLESSSESSERSCSEPSTTSASPGGTNKTTTGASVPPGNNTGSAGTGTPDPGKQILWPAWVYCTRYSDRPSSGRSPRTRRVKRSNGDSRTTGSTPEEKRPRTAFSGEQLARLKREFAENRYLTERRRQQLSRDLGLNEAQIKIWFQNKRAKIKKASGQKNPLALQLMAQGLYNHSTVPLTREEEEQAAELQAK